MFFGTACETMVEENDIELSLGLSLGGCFRRSEKSLGIRQISGETEEGFRSSVSQISGAVFGENKEVEIGGEVLDTQREFAVFREEEEIQIEGEVLNTQRKRKIQALRRQEARKKRKEQQQKKGIARGGKNGGFPNGNIPIKTGSIDEKMLLEAPEYQLRVEKDLVEQICRVTNEKDQHDLNQANPSSSFVPFVPMQYPFPHLQCVPFANGFSIPYAVPYWTAPPPATAAVGDEKNVFQPVACRAFRPFQAQNSNVNQNRSGSCDSEQNGSKGVGLKQVQSSCSSGSLGSNSSWVASHQGGWSSDTRSHSSRSASELPQLHTTVVNHEHGQNEHSASSQAKEHSEGIEEPDQNPDKTEGNPICIDKPITPPRSPTQPPQPLKEDRAEANRPPKPPQHHPLKTQALAHMPCVSAKGNGPNGKTITGFLYRYTKTEVSIICVCHGSSFTPAEFVKHAGCTDVSHPLKHIVVVPSPF